MAHVTPAASPISLTPYQPPVTLPTDLPSTSNTLAHDQPKPSRRNIVLDLLSSLVSTGPSGSSPPPSVTFQLGLPVPCALTASRHMYSRSKNHVSADVSQPAGVSFTLSKSTHSLELYHSLPLSASRFTLLTSFRIRLTIGCSSAYSSLPLTKCQRDALSTAATTPSKLPIALLLPYHLFGSALFLADRRPRTSSYWEPQGDIHAEPLHEVMALTPT
jgi:hypothetical protein